MNGSGVLVRRLGDGRRLHLNHGPIDLVIEAWGAREEVERAYAQASHAFETVLPDLVGELDLLRRPVRRRGPPVRGAVARRMVTACRPYLPAFITPMAAVAGAVADHILAALARGRRLAKAYVNDGGDIAFDLAPGEALDCGVVTDLAHPAVEARVRLTHEMRVRGIATSGRATKGEGGRSFSLGIADSVTALAKTAAAADAAATAIANAVDLPGHPAVERASAVSLDPDSDLGERLVTVGLGHLDEDEIGRALARGRRRAESLCEAGLIGGALLALRGHRAVVGGADALVALPHRPAGL